MPAEQEFSVNAYDGFHASLVEFAGGWDVVVEVMGAGEAVESHCVYGFERSKHTRGEAERLFCLVQAMCRYINASGRPSDAEYVCRFIAGAFSDYAIEFPEPWKILTVLQEIEEPTIILANDQTQEAIVIKEDLYAEKMTLGELNDQIR